MDRDLSNYHELVSDLFTFPTSYDEWQRYRLTDEQIALFNKNGYLTGIRALDDHQAARLCEELALLIEDEKNIDLLYEHNRNESTDASTTLFHCLGQWRILPGFHDILWHPAVTVPASQLLGGAVRFWHDQLFYKPARDGGVVAWHQDYSYWTRTQPMAHVTCWIGLDDSTRENGCVYYVPGSHRWNLLPKPQLAGDMDAISSVLTQEQKAMFKPVAIELKRGECSFHHPLMLHGSYGNKTERPRRAEVINMVKDGVKSASDHPLLEGVLPIPSGQPLGGRFFPLLFDPMRLVKRIKN